MATKDDTSIPSMSSTPISIAELLNNSSISSTKLAGSKNYHPWSAAIKTFLISKEKLRYIEEGKPSIAIPTWEKEDARWGHGCGTVWSLMLVAMLCCYLLPMQYGLLSKETYGNDGNIQRIYKLCEDIFLTKQALGLCMSITALWNLSGNSSTCSSHIQRILPLGNVNEKTWKSSPFFLLSTLNMNQQRTRS